MLTHHINRRRKWLSNVWRSNNPPTIAYLSIKVLLFKAILSKASRAVRTKVWSSDQVGKAPLNIIAINQCSARILRHGELLLRHRLNRAKELHMLWRYCRHQGEVGPEVAAKVGNLPWPISAKLLDNYINISWLSNPPTGCCKHLKPGTNAVHLARVGHAENTTRCREIGVMVVIKHAYTVALR